MAKYRVTVEVDADNAGQAATLVSAPLEANGVHLSALHSVELI